MYEHDYVIVTDTTADLPCDIYDKFNIHSVPMEFIIDGTSYQHFADAREMSFLDFYTNIKSGKKASTTQINYYTYESVFRPILDSGKDILYIAFSSGLSGTYQASTLVIKELSKEYPDRKIVSIDSLSASIGEGVLVYNAALLKEQGLSLDDLTEWVRENRTNACHWFVVNDLNHLKQGGRITALQATLGTALNLKPLLSVDIEGKLIPTAKLRGAKKIIDTFISKIKTDSKEPEEQTVIIGHANNLTFANKLKQRIEELSLVKNIILTDIGPIIGTHVGEGMTALAFMGTRNL